MAAPDPLTEATSGTLAWFLAIVRLNAVRRRVEREGLTEQVGDALLETLNDLTMAAVAIAAERKGAPS